MRVVEADNWPLSPRGVSSACRHDLDTHTRVWRGKKNCRIVHAD
jgi:hypothetical protein